MLRLGKKNIKKYVLKHEINGRLDASCDEPSRANSTQPEVGLIELTQHDDEMKLVKPTRTNPKRN